MTNDLNRTKNYAREKYAILILDILLTVIFFIIFQMLSFGITGAVSEVLKEFYLSLCLYLIIFSLTHYFFVFPLHFYSSFVLDHKYGLSNLSLSGWFKDELKKSILSGAVFFALIMIFYVLLRNSGGLWWVYLTVIWLLMTIFFAKIIPVAVIPLFYKYSHIESESLKKKITDVAGRYGISLLGVFRINFSKNTKKANAALVGMGGTRRIILSDTLIDNFSEDEITVVAAHEFAHHKLKHIPRLIAVHTISTLIGFYYLNLLMEKIMIWVKAGNVYDIILLPSFLLVITLLGLVLMPIQNAYSRALEKQADLDAIMLTGQRDVFVSVMNKLANNNMSDRKPPFLIKILFFDHPSIDERIAYSCANEAEKQTFIKSK